MMLGQLKRLEELNEMKFSASESNIPIVAFTSGKGGTGKTTLAVNFANLFAKKGKRVLVVDFDLNFANVHIMTNIFPEHTLADYFNKNYALDNVITKYNEKLHYVFGDSGYAGNLKITKGKLREFFSEINSQCNYDLIILDTSSGGAEDTLEILGFADTIIVVATTEPTAVMDAYAIIKLMLLKNISAKIVTLINKTKSKTDAEMAFSNIQTAVKHFLKKEVDLLGFIHESSAIKKSSFSQKLFTENELEKRIQTDVTTIISQLKVLIDTKKARNR